MTLIRLTDAQLHELMQAARMVPPDLRDIFLERVAVELQGKRAAADKLRGKASDDGDVWRACVAAQREVISGTPRRGAA
jgi:hypothetical protein